MDWKEKIQEVANNLPEITLVDASNLGDAGPGGTSFQTAVQNLNQDNYNGAESSFLDAIKQGLDPLREGYSYANIGNIKLKQDDLDNAISYFAKVFENNLVLYESAHTASGYLKIISSEMGLSSEATAFESLSTQTMNKLGYSLSPDAAEKAHQLVRAKL